MVTPLLRGAGLVEHVVARVRADGGKVLGERSVLPRSAIEQLRLPGGPRLPPSLHRWLAFDATCAEWLGATADTPPRELASQPLVALVEAAWGAEAAARFAPAAALLPGRCIAVPGSCDALRFLYAGVPDAYGELPVFVADVTDTAYVALEYPGFDVYLAESFDVLDCERDHPRNLFDDARWADAMAAQARLNFRGFRGLDLEGGDTEHLDGPRAAARRLRAAKRLDRPGRRA